MNTLVQFPHLRFLVPATTPRAPVRLPVDLTSVIEPSVNRAFRRLCEDSYPRPIRR